jgi:hypothetical protein
MIPRRDREFEIEGAANMLVIVGAASNANITGDLIRCGQALFL